MLWISKGIEIEVVWEIVGFMLVLLDLLVFMILDEVELLIFLGLLGGVNML